MFRFSFFLCFLFSLTSNASTTFSIFAGDYEPFQWSCTSGAYHWISDVKYIKIYRENDIILLNACAQNDDCEGRVPFENFYLSEVTSGRGWARGKGGAYLFSVSKKDRNLYIEVNHKDFVCRGLL